MNAHRASAIGLAGLLAACLAACASAADPPPAWELWPYRVQVLVAIDGGQLLPPSMKEELSALLTARVAAAVGGTWKLAVSTAADDLRHAILDDIDEVQPESLPTVEELDKVILLAACPQEGRLIVRARELDLATGLWNATVSIPSPQPEYLPHAAVRAVLSAFAPLARIENCDGRTATLRLRAGGLVPSGEKPLVAAAFRPVLMPCDASGTVTRGQAELIDWTYLTTTDSGRRAIECRVETALAGEVIPEYHPLRQRWGVGVSRSSTPTTLRLVSRGSDAQPVEGIEVVAEENPPVVIGQSDRRGDVLVPPSRSPVRTIIARQGDHALARLVIVPGLKRELIVPVDYDPGQVELEALLAQLADDVVDAAARLAILTARPSAAEAAGQSDAATSVNSLLTRLDRLKQAVQSAAPATRRRLEPKLTELRKGIEQIKSAAK